MRIEKVHIKSRFKNLENFEISFDKIAMETVLIGLNATGKSNFMESLVIIFRDLDLERPPQILKTKEPFYYFIKYECRGKQIEVEYSAEKGYEFSVDSITKSRSVFFKSKEVFLPKHVFIYYSGISERVDNLYSDHIRKHYEQLIKDDASHHQFDRIPRIFLVRNYHGSLALISFFMFNDQEQETLQFLDHELRIKDFCSALFIIKQPLWSKARKGEDEFWNARGVVRRFLEDLKTFAVAPIYHEERVAQTYKKSETHNHLYLFIKDKETFKALVDVKMYSNKVQLFTALNSIDTSDMLHSIKIKVEKEKDGELSMGELSEGEMQLLTILGMLKFTKDDEALILLDEPDTHLNPLWKWKFLSFIDKVVKTPKTTQIIFCTHDPVVIGNLHKSQVRIFHRSEHDGKTEVLEPDISPFEMSVSNILTSEFFGIPSVMSQGLEEKVNEKRYIQSQMINGLASDVDIKRYELLKKFLDVKGFYDTTSNTRYNLFLQLTSERKEFAFQKYTEKEKAELEVISREILDSILKSKEE